MSSHNESSPKSPVVGSYQYSADRFFGNAVIGLNGWNHILETRDTKEFGQKATQLLDKKYAWIESMNLKEWPEEWKTTIQLLLDVLYIKSLEWWLLYVATGWEIEVPDILPNELEEMNLDGSDCEDDEEHHDDEEDETD